MDTGIAKTSSLASSHKHNNILPKGGVALSSKPLNFGTSELASSTPTYYNSLASFCKTICPSQCDRFTYKTMWQSVTMGQALSDLYLPCHVQRVYF